MGGFQKPGLIRDIFAIRLYRESQTSYGILIFVRICSNGTLLIFVSI